MEQEEEGGEGWGRVWGGEGGWGGVGTFLLCNGLGSTEVTREMRTYIGPPTAGQLWKLRQLAWAVTAYIGHPPATELWQL